MIFIHFGMEKLAAMRYKDTDPMYNIVTHSFFSPWCLDFQNFLIGNIAPQFMAKIVNNCALSSIQL